MLLFAITSMAQNKITISGVVTDKTGETVIGASVRVKGQESKGSITDINGKYQIVDVASNATLIFSYIGMREQEDCRKWAFNYQCEDGRGQPAH